MWPFDKKAKRLAAREDKIEQIIKNHEKHLENLVRAQVGDSNIISKLGIDLLITNINKDNRAIIYEVSKL